MNPNIEMNSAAGKKLRAMERERRVKRRIQWDAPLVRWSHRIRGDG